MRELGGCEARHFELYVGFARTAAPRGVARAAAAARRARGAAGDRPGARAALSFRPAGAARRAQFVTMPRAALNSKAQPAAPNQLPGVCCPVSSQLAAGPEHERPTPPVDRRRRPRDPRPAGAVPGEARVPHHRGGRRQGDAARARALARRSAGARSDAAGRGRPVAVPRAAQPLAAADHHAHRARRGRRPHHRARARRR